MKIGRFPARLRHGSAGLRYLVTAASFLVLVFLCPAIARADDLAGLCASRTATEQVYYQHRLGDKPPFEQVSPPSLIMRLVREDLRKEAVLQRVYGVEITSAMLQAEVQRINTTTRAPDVLAEIKGALANDPVKFANAFARPILVERLLRDKFENDDALHAAIRREAGRVRDQLHQYKRGGSKGLDSSPRASTLSPQPNQVSELVGILKSGHSNRVSEASWELTPRPADTNTATADEIEIKKRFGPSAQIISSPAREKDLKLYFEDLPADLQRVLRVQLRQPGDVSAVIEAPGGFLLYVAEAKSDTKLKVACLSLPKRGYEQWLQEQLLTE